MAKTNYAFIKNGNVTNIAAFDDPSNDLLLTFKNEFDLDEILETTEKAVIGGTYDGTRFWSLQPFPSWVKDETTGEWIAPTPMPTPEPGFYFRWNEDALEWVEATLPTE